MKNNMCFLNVGSFRAFMSKNCGKNVKYLGPDHCLDRKEMRDQLEKRGVQVESAIIEGDQKFLVAGQYDLGRGLGFFDVNKERSVISYAPEFREVSLIDGFDFVFVATKNVHKKVSSGRISFLVFDRLIKGIEQNTSLPYILLEIMLEVLGEALVTTSDHTQILITLSKQFLNQFERKNLDFFETGSKILRFSTVIDDLEVTKKSVSAYISAKNTNQDDENVNRLFCCFK